MVKKRVSRKQLLKEPDDFMTLSAKTLQFANTNQKQILYGAIGIVSVVAVFFLFQFLSARSEQKAFALFQEAFSRYMTKTADPSETLDEMAKGKFAELIDQYGSSSAARLAMPLYADLMYQEGDYDGAIAMYEKALKGFSGEASFEQMIWIGLGYAFEGKKEYASAAQWFEKVAQTEGAPLRADAFFNLGRMYEALNETQKAVDAYEKITEDFSQSAHAKMAKDKAARLQG